MRAAIISSWRGNLRPRLSILMRDAVPSRTTPLRLRIIASSRQRYRLFDRVTLQSLYRNAYTNTDNYIADMCVEWKIKAELDDELHGPIDTLSVMRERIANDNNVALIKNKRVFAGSDVGAPAFLLRRAIPRRSSLANQYPFATKPIGFSCLTHVSFRNFTRVYHLIL